MFQPCHSQVSDAGSLITSKREGDEGCLVRIFSANKLNEKPDNKIILGKETPVFKNCDLCGGNTSRENVSNSKGSKVKQCLSELGIKLLWEKN